MSVSKKKFAGPTPEEKIVAGLVELMEAGIAPWRKPWAEDGFSGHHVNLLSGHQYRGTNVIFLTIGMHARGSAMPYWCGFAEAKKLGISPKKGSKCAYIVRPQLNRYQEEEVVDGADPTTKEWMAFKPTAVFNANDLEGEKLEELIKLRKFQAGYQVKPEPERLENAEAALRSWKVPVSFGGNQAFYAPAIDRIQLPERSAFNTAAAFCSTWAHEAIHSTGHHSRLDRDQAGRFGSADYAREELVAELGAVLLGDRLEIGSEIESHAAYLSHWIGLLKEEPKILLQVMRDANAASKLIWPEELNAPFDPIPVGSDRQPADVSLVALSLVAA
jgi:antirestriction protein ArdC